MKYLSESQDKAIRDFAIANGRNWKSKLRDKWMTGRYSAQDDSVCLQQIRNYFGPSWLFNFKLGKRIN
jgi:hypothetical protein